MEVLRELRRAEKAGLITPAQRVGALKRLWANTPLAPWEREQVDCHIAEAEQRERTRRFIQVDEHRPHHWGPVVRSLTLADGSPDPQGDALSMLTCSFTFPAKSPTHLVVSAGPRERMMLRAETLRERLLALGAHPESTVLIHPKEASSIGRNL